MFDPKERDRLASDLLAARDAAGFATLPDDSFDLDAGYEVGRVLHERLVGRGYRPVGRKIGFTNPSLWKQFGASGPVWAHVYDRTVHFAATEAVRLPLTGMAAPRLEPEVVLKLRHAVPPDATEADVAGCVEWAALGFEIVDSHFPAWRFTAAAAVADFGVHAALVVGPPWRTETEPPERVAEILRTVKVSLCGNGELFAEGEGRNALGSPLLALRFLAGVVAGQPWAPPLAAGEVVTTGTLTALPHLRAGERWRAEAEGGPFAAVELVTE